MKSRILVLAIVSALSVASFRSVSVIDVSRIYARPQGKKRIGKETEWKQNLRSANQRQRGLRLPIGRGK